MILNFQTVNNKGADQSAQMHRLVCTFVVRKTPKTGLLPFRLKCICIYIHFGPENDVCLLHTL